MNSAGWLTAFSLFALGGIAPLSLGGLPSAFVPYTTIQEVEKASSPNGLHSPTPGGPSQGCLIPRHAPMVLEYHTRSRVEEGSRIFRIFQSDPDLWVEWEEGFGMGSLMIPGEITTHSRAYLRQNRLENGRDVTLAAATLAISRDVYGDLAAGRRARLKINGIDGWMETQKRETFPLAGLAIPVLRVKDQLGTIYLVQDCEAFPLILSQESPYYREWLSRMYEGEDVIFRWIGPRRFSPSLQSSGK